MTKFSVLLKEVSSAQYLLTASPDMINSHLRQGKVWDASLLEISRLLLSHCESPVVVDVGANLGAYAVPMGQFLAPLGGRLYAFEPQRMVFYQLCANLFANRLAHCHAFHLAVGAGAARVDVPLLDVATERNLGALSLDPAIRKIQGTLSSTIDRTEKVSMVSLSQLDLPPGDLVKIDVEGLELQVLQGAHHWLARSGYPPLLFEVWGDVVKGFDEHRRLLFEFVEKTMGYEVLRVGENCLAQHPQRKLVQMQRTDAKTVQLRLLPAPPTPQLKPLRVAMVTATGSRTPYLRQCQRYFEAQRHEFAALHWFVLDDSAVPDPQLSNLSHPGIHYEWQAQRLSPGARLNRLNDMARAWGADVICTLDDAQWYGPDYASDMARLLLTSGLNFAGSSQQYCYGTWNKRIVRTLAGSAAYSRPELLCYRTSAIGQSRFDEAAVQHDVTAFLGGRAVAQHPEVMRVQLNLVHRANTPMLRNFFMLPECQTDRVLEDLPMTDEDRYFVREESLKFPL